VTNGGSDGVGTGRPGDLYAILIVHDDPRFVRDGSDLHFELELTFAQAAVGDQLNIEGLEGPIAISVNSGTQPGAEIRMKGHGLPRLHSNARGDLIGHVKIGVPKKITEGQAKLLREFAELGDEPIPQGPQDGSFLGGLFKKGKKK